MKYVLGIDFGGGSSKATLLSSIGEIVATATSEYPTYYPGIGFVEQNPEDWYKSAKENIQTILKISGVTPGDILCVSLDAATHTAVLTDENFTVLCPSIYWTDTRSTKQVAYLKEQHAELILEQVYHAPGTIWTLPQLMWLWDNQPELMAKVKKIMFAKDYVRHQLTGDFYTDFIEAQGSMFYNMNTGTWSQELCRVGNIDPAWLPKIKKPTDLTGTVTSKAARDTGLLAGTPVICGTTDTVMEVFAAGAVEPGNMTLKLATAGRICVITDRPYPDKNLVNYAHVTEGLWYPGTATKSCAASLRWMRDNFGGTYEELTEAASQIPVGSDGLIFHPYLNGELTPHQNPNLCGSFVGIRGGHTKAHFTRALLEGVAFSMLDCMQTLETMNITHDKAATVIGGGAKGALWRQIISDCLGIELVGKESSDSSFGSAMLAGIYAGFFVDEKAAFLKCSKNAFVTKPNFANTEIYARIHEKYTEIYHALKGIYQ